MLKSMLVRAFELSAIYGPVIVMIFLAWRFDVTPLWYVVAFILAPSVPLTLWFMPSRCRSEGGVYKICTPVRCVDIKGAEVLGDVRGGRIPPGKSYALFCLGWRSLLTFFADCGEELFFSTPSCDGRWMRIRGEVKGRQKEVWLCGCR